jgi:hypothetical protein
VQRLYTYTPQNFCFEKNEFVFFSSLHFSPVALRIGHLFVRPMQAAVGEKCKECLLRKPPFRKLNRRADSLPLSSLVSLDSSALPIAATGGGKAPSPPGKARRDDLE